MELFYYKDPSLNFGDDLNAELWPLVLPRAILDAPNLVVIGIGSILSEEWVGKYSGSNRSVVVLGTGTSYDKPPRDMRGWSILAVRGPLTAELIQMPQTAITDGAILLADAPTLIGPPRTREDIIFMPHHRSVRRSPWKQIAEAAGMRYVSPQQPVKDVLAAFARAKLVVTEAMHGAIVADTLRVPWIPIIVSPGIDEFKWRDWCLSMDVPFHPRRIDPGHASDVRHYTGMRRVLENVGLAGHDELKANQTRQDLERYFDRRFSTVTKTGLLNPVPTGTLSRLRSLSLRAANPLFRKRAVHSLMEAGEGESFLSRDDMYLKRLNQMRGAVMELEKIALRKGTRTND